MLRMVFVLGILMIGIFFAVQSPFYALLLYLWNAYFRPEEWTFGPFIYSLHLSLILGIWVVIRTLLALPKPQLNMRTGLILLFFGQAIIGTLTSEHPEWSASFLNDFVKVLLISYLIVVLVTDREKYRVTLVVIALSLGFECAKQGWVNLYRAPGAKNDNSIPFLGDNNGVALGTMMLVPILGALAQTAERRWEKFAFRFLAIGVFLRGFTTYSRGGFLAAGVLGLATIARSERKVRAIVSVAFVLSIVAYVMPQSFWDRMNTIAVADTERDDSAAGRLHFWRTAVQMAERKPLIGVGLNGFSQSYEAYNTDGRFLGQRVTHSSWFGVLGDLGYPGLILFVANWLTAVWSCWRVASRTKGDTSKRELRIYANALMTSLCVFAVAGTFISHQYSEMLWHFLGLSTALHALAVREIRAAEPVVQSPSRMAIGTFANAR